MRTSYNEEFIHILVRFVNQCLRRRITDLTSPTQTPKVLDMAETSKKHDRELRRKEKKAAREARHNTRNAA